MYRNFHTYFWDDPKVKKWPPLAKYLFGFLFTNSRAHIGGIYVIETFFISGKTGLSEKQVRELLDFLQSEKVVCYDPDREVVWVVNMFAHQTHNRPSSLHIRSIVNHLDTLHDSVLISPFLKHYERFHIQ